MALMLVCFIFLINLCLVHVFFLSLSFSLSVTLVLSLSHAHIHTFSHTQAHMQSGLVQSHHPGQTHPTMMLMATQGPPGGPQQQMQQTALNPIPVSSTTHFSYLAHPQGMFILLTSTLLLGGVMPGLHHHTGAFFLHSFSLS